MLFLLFPFKGAVCALANHKKKKCIEEEKGKKERLTHKKCSLCTRRLDKVASNESTHTKKKSLFEHENLIYGLSWVPRRIKITHSMSRVNLR